MFKQRRKNQVLKIPTRIDQSISVFGTRIRTIANNMNSKNISIFARIATDHTVLSLSCLLETQNSFLNMNMRIRVNKEKVEKIYHE